ncbi:nuclear transport factor 2 family protein [Pseudoalteromonas sp. MSK9-3]|uniref:nuclear transport factor 2 family protein n=1 Tax=Pseudoalteromonas sp. MSK9-3 TaxID=1897633 RepID=UPI0015FFA7B9|nr:nuclear transport factor 2 family protein [Pseudoalteromonas sp. MSK9-3]
MKIANPLKHITLSCALGLSTISLPTIAEENTYIQSTTARNEALVVEFVNKTFNERADIEETAKRYLARNFIQHNPNIPTGRAALVELLQSWLPYVPGQVAEIKRVISSDDLVVLHVHYYDKNSGELGNAAVDIFRVNKRGKIAEHWDVIQPIPAESANNNGMF